MTCHPSHQPTPEERTERHQQAQEQRRAQQKKDLAPDPRKIRRQHRWKLAHDPVDQDDYDDPAVRYLELKGREAPPTAPDQLDLLSGGPESGMTCERCGVMTRIVGEMSKWDIMTQPEVGIVNLDSISEVRKKELQEEMVCVLKCPECYKSYQWAKDLLPRRD